MVEATHPSIISFANVSWEMYGSHRVVGCWLLSIYEKSEEKEGGWKVFRWRNVGRQSVDYTAKLCPRFNIVVDFEGYRISLERFSLVLRLSRAWGLENRSWYGL